MLGVQGDSSSFKVEVSTVDHRGWTAEEVAQRALDRIIQVGENSHPLVRDQALAFREHIRQILVFYLNEVVKFDRVTLANRLREAGHPELIKLLDE